MLYVEDWEVVAMDITLRYTGPSMWRQYTNNLFKAVKQDKRDELTERLGSIGSAGGIGFTGKPGMEGVCSFHFLMHWSLMGRMRG